MKKLLIAISILIAVSFFNASAQNKSFELTKDEINMMNAAIKADTNLSKLLGLFGEPVDLYKQYKINRWRADKNHSSC